jgi:hypothetical protein
LYDFRHGKTFETLRFLRKSFPTGSGNRKMVLNRMRSAIVTHKRSRDLQQGIGIARSRAAPAGQVAATQLVDVVEHVGAVSQLLAEISSDRRAYISHQQRPVQPHALFSRAIPPHDKRISPRGAAIHFDCTRRHAPTLCTAQLYTLSHRRNPPPELPHAR